MHTRNRLRRFHRDRRGSFSLSNMAILLFMLVTTMCLLNEGVSLSDRATQQRRADSSALCLAIHKARYMNAVVAHQHCMGEILSLIIAHHAFGGDLLDADQAADTGRSDTRLRSAYRLARSLGYRCPAYPNVSSRVLAGEALLEAHLDLKSLLTTDYYLLVTAWVLKRIPFTRTIGIALERLGLLIETQIHTEWRVLDVLRRVARGLTPLKKLMQSGLQISKAKLNAMILEYPLSQRRFADELEKRFDLKLHILPSDRWLPVKEDPWARATTPPGNWQPPQPSGPAPASDALRTQIVKVTQLARATFPWVAYNRQPLVSRLMFLTPLCGMSSKYFHHTNQVTQRFLNEMQLHGPLSLFVLSDYDGPDKALEPWIWASGTGQADRSFGVTVLVGAASRKPVGEALFDHANHAYRYRVASAVIWNRHAPIAPGERINVYQDSMPAIQAQTGWDTLNWHPGIALPELGNPASFHAFPAIQCGWEASLSPTSPARWEQMQVQPLPVWAQSLNDVMPDQLSQEFVGL